MLLDRAAAIVGPDRVLTGAEAEPWRRDATGTYPGEPIAVLRPGSTVEVSALMRLATETRTPVVPVSGNTGLTGGGQAKGALVLSLDRLNAIREIRPAARIAVVEAGVVLQTLHDTVEAQGLTFPMTFGARGSARIGGILSTNAGGSNVLRHGNARDLCLGIEAVLSDGRVLDLMGELHKDNSGYHLRDLLIGAEGTLGIVTAAVLKLRPLPRARATAMAALTSLDDALELLNRLQDETSGGVEAFEFMPRSFIEGYRRLHPETPEPFDGPHPVNLLIEVAATAARDSEPGPDGALPVEARLMEVLAAMLDEGRVQDAVLARSEAQRRAMWARREAAAEIAFSRRPFVDTDIAVPLDRVAAFFDAVRPRVEAVDPGLGDLAVAHLGDGNIHYTLYPTRDDPVLKEALREAVEEVVQAFRGSFSAEHGIGQSKLGSMRRRKDPAAVEVMRSLKAALDPLGLLNPGKVIPEPS